DSLAERRNAGRGRIAVMAVAQRLDRRLDDELRRAEVRLADAEIDDVAALRRQRIGAGQHGERVFLADAVECRDGLQHWLPSGVAVRKFARVLSLLRGELPNQSDTSNLMILVSL